MMICHISLLISVLLIICWSDGLLATEENFAFSNVLGSGMVLQRGVAARIWGFGGRSTSYSVACTLTWNGNTSAGSARGTVKSDTRSSWSVDLPSQPGTATPFTIQCTLMTSTSSQQPVSGVNAISIDNVLFGDVFLCAGEGNMQMSVAGVTGASLEIQQAQNYPYIRVFSVGQSNYSTSPLSELAKPPQVSWTRASSTSIGGSGAFSYFSATCWFFGRSLYDSANWGHVPIGLIAAAWAESYLTAWAPAGVLSSCPTESTGDVPNRPSLLYNSMINPFLSMALHGFVWYQGESDLRSNSNPASFYRCAQPALIQSWRTRWNMGAQLPFYYVQLEPFTVGGPYGSKLADLRVSQVLPSSSNANSCCATAIDLGDYSSPYGNVYPRTKKAIGARLAICALATSYGSTNATTAGPQPVSAKLTNAQQVFLQYASNTVVGGLNLIFNSACPDPGECATFAVGNSKGVSAPVTSIQIDSTGTALLLATPWGTDTRTISYAMADWPVNCVFNIAGVPGFPFNLTLSKS